MKVYETGICYLGRYVLPELIFTRDIYIYIYIWRTYVDIFVKFFDVSEPTLAPTLINNLQIMTN